jgi:hypothetical protein
MMTFDGSAREVCTARRIRTNTPLQALVTLNDSVYVEAAYHLASLMQKTSGDLQEQIRWVYQRALGHAPSAEAMKALTALHDRTAAKMEVRQVKNAAANQRDGNANEALMLIANAILNLDEFVTKN